MPLADTLADIAAPGWLISNPHQHDDGTWRANLRSQPDADSGAYRATAFAEAPTLELALFMCVDKMEQAPTFQSAPITSSIDTNPSGADRLLGSTAPRPSLSTLLSNLRPTPALPRRL